jgi:hypothetical protein
MSTTAPREPSVEMEATRRCIRTRLTYLVRTPASDLPDRDNLLRHLLLEYHNNWECPEGWSPEELPSWAVPTHSLCGLPQYLRLGSFIPQYLLHHPTYACRRPAPGQVSDLKIMRPAQ